MPTPAGTPADPPARPPFLTAAASPAAVPPPVVTDGESAADAMAASGQGVYDFDLITGEARWSRAALAIYGGFPAPPTATQLRARVHPSDWPKLYAVRINAEVAARAEHARTGLPPAPVRVDVPHRVVRPDGSVRRVRACGEYRFGPDGTPWRSVGALRDETDAVPADDPLDAAVVADRFGRALAAAGLGTFDFDPAADRVTWDARTKVVFGLPVGAPDQRPLGHILGAIHADDRADARAKIAAAMDPRTGGHFDSNHRIVRPDGSVRRVGCRADVIFADGPDGRRAVRTVGVIEDLTD